MRHIKIEKAASTELDADLKKDECIQLWFAVMQRALVDAVRPASARKQNKACPGSYTKKKQQEAKKWIHSESEEVGSFLWICDNLDIRPEALRHAVENRPAEFLRAAKRTRNGLVYFSKNL